MKKIGIILLSCFLIASCASPEAKKLAEGKKSAARINATLGVTYLDSGQVERAKEKLLLSMQQDPNYPGVYSAMGYFLEKTGESLQADTYYRRSIRLSSGEGEYINNYAAYLCRAGRYNEAVKSFVEIANRIDYVKQGQAYANAGLCEMKRKNYVQAEKYFKKSMASNSYQTGIMLDLSEAAYYRGHFHNAKKYLSQYVEKVAPSQRAVTLGLRIAKKLDDDEMTGYYKHFLKTSTGRNTA